MLVVMHTVLKEEIYSLPIPILPQLAYWFVFMVMLMIQMRILGLLYFMNRHKLAWF